MRIVVLGATGNVGTSVVEALVRDPAVAEVIAVARRRPGHSRPKVAFVKADIASDDLVSIFRGADAVIHLAWLIQPARDRTLVRRVNVTGTERVLRAVIETRVPCLLYASSVGAYSPGPKHDRADESWPTGGIHTSVYASQKAAVERVLDRLEREQPQLRIVRMRPALVFKREAGAEIQRLFLGPLFPRRLAQPRLIPVVPDVDGLRFQVVHSRDVADAFTRALLRDVRGAFNLAAEPDLGTREVAALLRARPFRVAPSVARAAAAATYRLHLQPSEPGWLDMALAIPTMDSSRARHELGWEPTHSATDTLIELLDGIANHVGSDTPPLTATTPPRRASPPPPPRVSSS